MGPERDQDRTKPAEHLGTKDISGILLHVQHKWIRLTNKKFMTVKSKLREGKIKTFEDKIEILIIIGIPD